MHTLFNPENKFWNFMGKITDVAIMSILWLLTSLPIITIGASTAAFYSFTIDAVGDYEGNVFTTYFTAFKENFRQCTALWLMQLIAVIFVSVNLFAAWHFYLAKGIIALALLSLALCGTLIVIGTGFYLYPIAVCYDFPIRKVITDSFIMAMGNLHVTVSILVLFVIAGVCIYYISGLFFFWLGLAFFFSSYFIWGLFQKYAGIKLDVKKKKKKKPIDPYL